MIIKAKRFPAWVVVSFVSLVSWLIGKRFNKLVIKDVTICPNHSYLLMCNHFSFWDGFWAGYLSYKAIHPRQKIKGIYIMVVKKQMQMNPWLKYVGCFSINPGRASVNESLAYAASLLNTPGNIVVMYPQGNLESNHVREIVMKDGISHVMAHVQGHCQLLWSSNFVEYFESIRPSVYFHMLDCGTNKDFEFGKLVQRVNAHHKTAMRKQFRFTEEGEGS